MEDRDRARGKCEGSQSGSAALEKAHATRRHLEREVLGYRTRAPRDSHALRSPERGPVTQPNTGRTCAAQRSLRYAATGPQGPLRPHRGGGGMRFAVTGAARSHAAGECA